MKRIIAALVSFTVIFMVASCSSGKNSSSSPEETIVTESAQTTEVTGAAEVTMTGVRKLLSYMTLRGLTAKSQYQFLLQTNIISDSGAMWKDSLCIRMYILILMTS